MLLLLQNVSYEYFYKAFGSTFNVIFDIFNHSTNKKYVCEANVSISVSGSTYSLDSIIAYDANDGTIKNIIANNGNIALKNMYDFGTDKMVSCYYYSTKYFGITQAYMSGGMDADIEIIVKPSMQNQLFEHIKRGDNTLRPAILTTKDVGLEYFDTSLNKPIYVKSVDVYGVATWVDATGTVV